VKVSNFTACGVEFQRRMVPQVEEAKLVRLEKNEGEFLLTLDTGETFATRKVILAVGISSYADVPPALSALSLGRVGHSSQVLQPAVFAGDVVVGSGASAIDLAALREPGAKVTIVSRRRSLEFHDNKPEVGDTTAAGENTGSGDREKRIRRASHRQNQGVAPENVTREPRQNRQIALQTIEEQRREAGEGKVWISCCFSQRPQLRQEHHTTGKQGRQRLPVRQCLKKLRDLREGTRGS
jgi:cation diffusion facilitator CzcD-associated flavoprotein CzcO